MTTNKPGEMPEIDYSQAKSDMPEKMGDPIVPNQLSEMKMLVRRTRSSVVYAEELGVRWVRFAGEDWRRLQELAGKKNNAEEEL